MTFLGRLSDLLERLSDLQLGDEKGTLNHLVHDSFLNNLRKFDIITKSTIYQHAFENHTDLITQKKLFFLMNGWMGVNGDS